MDNATTMYIVIGLLFIFFVVLLVFSAKSWRVLHLITAFLVFIAGGMLLWFTAATLRTHEEWRTAYNALTKKVAEQEAEQQKLLVGAQTAAERGEASVRQAQANLRRVLVDRGRVWRNLEPEVAADSITLNVVTVPAPPAAAGDEDAESDEDAPAEPPAEGEEGEVAPVAPAGRHGIEANTVVYAFLEGESVLSGDLKGAPPFMVPVMYLGEFRVTGRTDTTITVAPVSRLTAAQQSALGEGNWTIYDNMPVDAQFAFDSLSADDLRALFPQDRLTFSDDQYNARIAQLTPLFDGKTPQAVAAMIPRDSVLLTDDQYEQLISQYLNSGKAVDNPDDFPADTIWKQMKMLAPVSIQVDAVLRDVKGSKFENDFEITAATAVKRQGGEVVIGETALISAKPGDQELGQLRLALTVTETLKQVSDYQITELWNGRPGEEEAAPPVLKALTELEAKDLEEVLEVKSVALDIGDVATFHPDTAKFLVDNNLAEVEKSIYMRPLRDYAHYFNDSHRQELLFEDAARVMKADTATLLAANAKALEQVTYRADEMEKLVADREGFRREAAAISVVETQAAARFAAARAKLSELYKSNLQLASNIKTLQLRWAAEYQNAPAVAAPATPAPTSPIPSTPTSDDLTAP